VSGTIAVRVNKLWSACHIHEAARVHQLRRARAAKRSSSSPFGPVRPEKRSRAGPDHARGMLNLRFSVTLAATYGYYPYLPLLTRSRHPIRHGRIDGRRVPNE